MFKDKLKQLRLERNLTQSDVANALNVSAATIGNYEQGTREPRNNSMWKKIADYFGVSIDELMDKTESTTRYMIKTQGSSNSSDDNWNNQIRMDVPIIYDDVDITHLVFSNYNEKIPVTREQQFAYADYLGRSGHILYARKNLLEIIEDIKKQSVEELLNNLHTTIEYIETHVVYWYKRCWNNIDDLFPSATDLETLFDLIDKCLCVDMIAEQEFSLVPIRGNFDWLREKLR